MPAPAGEAPLGARERPAATADGAGEETTAAVSHGPAHAIIRPRARSGIARRRREPSHEIGELAGNVDGGSVLEVRPHDLETDGKSGRRPPTGAVVAGNPVRVAKEIQ